MPGRGGSSQSGQSSSAKDRNRSEGSSLDRAQHIEAGAPPSPPPRQKRDSGTLTDILNHVRDLKQDVASLKGRIENLEGKVIGIERDRVTHQTLDQEMSILIARIEATEAEMQKLQQMTTVEFDPQVTLVAQGLPVTQGTDLISQAKFLVNRALNEPGIPVVRATRLPSRNNRPGLVKIEVNSLENKIKLLRKKFSLKDTQDFKNVYLRSSKSHVERLLELNIMKLLDEIPNGKDKYKLTSNGRLVERNRDGNQQQSRIQRH